jgi:ribosome-associated protein
MTPLDIAKEAAVAAADRKAVRPILLDLRGVSDLCEFQFICSGENERQTRAIADAIEERCRKVGGIRPLAIEGKQTGNWILLDYGPTLIHIFYASLRDYYALEGLWPKAKFLPVKIDAAAAPNA